MNNEQHRPPTAEPTAPGPGGTEDSTVTGPPPTQTDKNEATEPAVAGPDLNSPTVYGSTSGSYHTGPADEPTVADTSPALTSRGRTASSHHGATTPVPNPTADSHVEQTTSPTTLGPTAASHHDQPPTSQTNAPAPNPIIHGHTAGSHHNKPNTGPADEPTISNTGPTTLGPAAGSHHDQPPTGPADEPTIANTGPAPTTLGHHERPPTSPTDEPTVADTGPAPNNPTAGSHRDQPPGPADESTIANTGPAPTTLSPAAGSHHEQPPTSPADEPTIANTGPAPTTLSPTAGSHHHEQPPTSPADEPTVANTGSAPNNTAGSHRDQPPGPADESTIADTGSNPTTLGSHVEQYASPVGELAATLDRPTVYGPATGSQLDGPTVANLDEPTIAMSRPDDDITVRSDVDATMAVGTSEATTTGPTVAGWPADVPEQPPLGDLVWRTDPPPAPKTPKATRSPAYYLSLGAAVVLVVGLVAAAAIFSVVRPSQEVAGTAKPTQGIPEITAPTSETPTQPTATAPAGPLSALARHPLSTSTTQMAPTACALPRFDPADDKQAAFYLAAKKCAADAWRGVLNDMPGDVQLVTVTAVQQTGSCGEIAPTSAAVQCDGTVYMTPAHLRDTEQNGRYPGRYLGVFLREYAKALQFTTGLSPLVNDVTTGSADDLDTRLAQQATCLAGVAAGAMSGLGAVDTNITNEIRARLSEVDAPADAKSWLDKGFAARQPAACNTWAN